MPFSIRPDRRFPVYCPVAYHAGLSQGHGTIWNLSVSGWRLSGDVPLQVGQSCPLTITVPNQQGLFVAAVIVRWVRGLEYGVETLVIEKQTHSRLAHWVTRLAQDSVGASHE
jgi:PilZ domain